jgi:hypothetical protein
VRLHRPVVDSSESARDSLQTNNFLVRKKEKKEP